MLADLYSILFILFSGKEKKRDFNGAQEDQRVRLQEIVEGAFQEAFWTRFAHQICSSKSLTLGPLISSLNQSINCLERCYKR